MKIQSTLICFGILLTDGPSEEQDRFEISRSEKKHPKYKAKYKVNLYWEQYL